MVIIRKKILFSQVTIVGITLALGAPLSHGASEGTINPRSISQAADAAANFAGTWHWICNGKRAVTMVLSPSGTGLTGSVSVIEGIRLDKDGTVLQIDLGDGTTPILHASIDGPVLHFKIKDDSDETAWTMTLRESGTAQMQAVAPEGPAMRPIMAEKAR